MFNYRVIVKCSYFRVLAYVEEFKFILKILIDVVEGGLDT